MILQAYLVTAAVSLTSLAVNNSIIKKKMQRDGFVFKDDSLIKRIFNSAPLIIFGITPIYNIIVTGAILTRGHYVNKYMTERLLENAERPVVGNIEPIIQEETTNSDITKLEQIKTPQDRISYVGYEYDKVIAENKPYTLVKKR